ncbi:MAG: hypothetical protein M9962_04455 [Oligoflexia bacterium]|nr:hypothetical protein [Oligoflexia bacterium]
MEQMRNNTEKNYRELYNDLVRSAPQVDTDALKNILQGEISAVEAYDEAIRKLSDDEKVTEEYDLSIIRQHHINAVNFWKLHLVSNSDAEEKNITSGIWGTVVEIALQTANFIGHTTLLNTLRDGEVMGLDQYQELLKNPSIPPLCKTHVKETIIPNIDMHIQRLNLLIQQ